MARAAEFDTRGLAEYGHARLCRRWGPAVSSPLTLATASRSKGLRAAGARLEAAARRHHGRSAAPFLPAAARTHSWRRLRPRGRTAGARELSGRGDGTRDPDRRQGYDAARDPAAWGRGGDPRLAAAGRQRDTLLDPLERVGR